MVTRSMATQTQFTEMKGKCGEGCDIGQDSDFLTQSEGFGQIISWLHSCLNGLEKWFSTGEILPSTGHLAVFEHIFNHHNCEGSYGI